MTNENVPHTPATPTALTKAQRRTLRRREKRAKDAAQLHGRDGGRAAAPATQKDAKNAPKEPQFPQLSGAVRRALSRTTDPSSTEIKAIRVAQTSSEAERQRKSAARDTELRRRMLNRRLPKR